MMLSQTCSSSTLTGNKTIESEDKKAKLEGVQQMKPSLINHLFLYRLEPESTSTLNLKPESMEPHRYLDRERAIELTGLVRRNRYRRWPLQYAGKITG